jgi:four helix bundle protein
MYEGKSEVAKRAYRFGVDVIKLTSKLPRNTANAVLVRQVIRSSTSIGANIEEALGGHTKNDFTYGMNVAKKEARETRYWLRVISDVNSKSTDLPLQECEQLINILTKIVKTSFKK